MHAIEVMSSLAAGISQPEKEQILLNAFLDGSKEFFSGVRLALDPFTIFNITKVTEIIEDDDEAGDYRFDDFLELARGLYSGAIVGDPAREAIHQAALRCHGPTWNVFYRRILLKNLQVDLDSKTVNKVLSSLLPDYPEVQQYVIPVFKCQMPHNGLTQTNRKKIRGRKLLDVKIHGVRVLAVLDHEIGCVNLFSHTGSVLDNFFEVHAGLKSLLSRIPGSVVLDGALVSPHGLEHLTNLIRRKQDHPDMALIRYALFDMLPLVDFRRAFCPKPQYERHRMLEALQEVGLWAETGGLVYVIPQVEVDLNTIDGQAAFTAFNQQAMADGFEGIVIKDPDAPYEGKRSAAWLKYKLSVSDELIFG